MDSEILTERTIRRGNKRIIYTNFIWRFVIICRNQRMCRFSAGAESKTIGLLHYRSTNQIWIFGIFFDRIADSFYLTQIESSEFSIELCELSSQYASCASCQASTRAVRDIVGVSRIRRGLRCQPLRIRWFWFDAWYQSLTHPVSKVIGSKNSK